MAASGATLTLVNLDSSDPAALTAFWAEALGWEVTYSDADYGMIVGPAGATIGFGRIENYDPPAWPDDAGAKRYHLDLSVDDVEQAKTALIALGARLAQPQPEPDRWTVMLDPQGHPFCIVPRAQEQ